MITISTLATLAQASMDRHSLADTLVALDARMGEIYWAIYQRNKSGIATLKDSEKLDKLDKLNLETLPASGAGHGWKVILDNSPSWMVKHNDIVIHADFLPDAAAML